MKKNEIIITEEQVEETEEQFEETPFDRIMNMKSSIHSMLVMLEAVNDSYKKAYMQAVIKSAVAELKKLYEM